MENKKPHFRETDSTYPNSPVNTPSSQPQGSPLMGQVTKVWGMDWPRKPLGKAPKGQGKGISAKTTPRSGVHKLGMKHRKTSGWF